MCWYFYTAASIMGGGFVTLFPPSYIECQAETQLEEAIAINRHILNLGKFVGLQKSKKCDEMWRNLLAINSLELG